MRTDASFPAVPSGLVSSPGDDVTTGMVLPLSSVGAGPEELLGPLGPLPPLLVAGPCGGGLLLGVSDGIGGIPVFGGGVEL